MKKVTIVVALGIVCSPLWLVWRVAGIEGLNVLLIIMGCFVGISILYTIAHWALETVLVVGLGCDREKINHNNRQRPTIIFWR